MNEIVKHDNLMMSAYNAEKSVNLRRFLNDSSDIDSILSPIERNVFDASLKTPIINIDDNTLLHKTASLFKYIAKDVGFCRLMLPNGHILVVDCCNLLKLIIATSH